MLNFKFFLKATATITAVLILSGCGIKTVKQDVETSDARHIMAFVNTNNYDKYVVDGDTPETAKVGVPESKIQKFNNSAARHVVNLFAGGIPGMLSLGLLQSDSYAKYRRDYRDLNLPLFLIVSNDSNEALSAASDIVTRSSRYSESKDGAIYFNAEGHGHKLFKENGEGDCKKEELNCFLYDFVEYGSDRYDKSSFPKTMVPDFPQSEKGYIVSRFYFREFVNGLALINFEKYRYLISSMPEKVSKNTTTFLYLPAEFNNGTPVVIDESGKEYFFVKR